MSITPLGLPVVPLVYTKVATSSGWMTLYSFPVHNQCCICEQKNLRLEFNKHKMPMDMKCIVWLMAPTSSHMAGGELKRKSSSD